MVRKNQTENKKSTDNYMIIRDVDGEKELARYSPKMVETIRNTVAKNSTNEELYMFLQIANIYGLNPFTKEIFFAKTNKGQNMLLTSRDGYLKIAESKPNFKKIQSAPVFENDDFRISMENGDIKSVSHSFSQKDRGALKGAYAVLQSRDGTEDLVYYANFREYNKGTQVWKSYPTAMICKCAETFVLKRFGGISGLVTQEEMGMSLDESEKLEASVNQINEAKDVSNIIDVGVVEQDDEPVEEVVDVVEDGGSDEN